MNSNSNELDFIYYFNKSLILIEHVDIYYQKQILDDIKKTTNELNNLFSKNYFDCEEKRKNKLLETINRYLDDTINNQIIYLINIYKKDNQHIILNNCEKKLRNILEDEKSKLDNKLNKKISTSVDSVKNNLYKNINYSDHSTKNIEYLIQEKVEHFFIQFENKIKKDIDYVINDQLYNDINSKIEINNSKLQEKVENFLKIFFKDENFYKKIINKVKDDLNEIYSYIDENNEIINDYKKIKKLIDHNENNLKHIEKNIFKKINTTLENKVVLLSNIFNEKISSLMINVDNKLKNNVNNNSNDNFKNIENKINTFNFSKNNFKIDFDKESNEIKLYYFNELISNTRINIKGMIGPKGPQGTKGEKGDLSIIRKIEVNKDNTYKFTIQSGTNIYDINSDSKIPVGPSGPKGDKGEPGDVNIKLNWNQEDVIKINKENQNNLNFLKSISIGDNSHCMENNSLSIGSGICYKENSITLGNNSKTLNENSIAFFGSTIGKNSFSFLSENVQENSFSIGDLINDEYNIENIHLNSKKIFLNCDELILNENKLKDKQISNLEERINKLESDFLLINR